MRNPFQLKHPGHKIYAGFVECAAERADEEHPEVWRGREAEAVLQAAVAVSSQHGLGVPDLADIKAAQIQAMGHSDYGVTWVCEVLKRMRNKGGEAHVR